MIGLVLGVAIKKSVNIASLFLLGYHDAQQLRTLLLFFKGLSRRMVPLELVGVLSVAKEQHLEVEDTFMETKEAVLLRLLKVSQRKSTVKFLSTCRVI